MRHIELLPEPLPPEPLVILNRWMAEAWQHRHQPNPNAMVLATSDSAGRPSARVVLCKEVVPLPGYLVFYTNYLSRKGRQLAENPRAAAVIHWDALHRQVRIEGPVLQAPAADSDAYFASRPWASRVGAWASAQSEPVASRDAMLESVAATAERFGAPLPGQPGAESDLDTAGRERARGFPGGIVAGRMHSADQGCRRVAVHAPASKKPLGCSLSVRVQRARSWTRASPSTQSSTLSAQRW